MSAISSSLPKNGHLSGLLTSSLVNITVPSIVSSSYVDSGNQIHCTILFTVDPVMASTASSFNFRCDQISSVTYNAGTINAIGVGVFANDFVPVGVIGVNSTSNINVSWVNGTTITAGQMAINFVITRS